MMDNSHCTLKSNSEEMENNEDEKEILTKIDELQGMAIRVVEFSNGGYKIRKIFAKESTLGDTGFFRLQGIKIL